MELPHSRSNTNAEKFRTPAICKHNHTVADQSSAKGAEKVVPAIRNQRPKKFAARPMQKVFQTSSEESSAFELQPQAPRHEVHTDSKEDKPETSAMKRCAFACFRQISKDQTTAVTRVDLPLSSEDALDLAPMCLALITAFTLSETGSPFAKGQAGACQCDSSEEGGEQGIHSMCLTFLACGKDKLALQKYTTSQKR